MRMTGPEWVGYEDLYNLIQGLAHKDALEMAELWASEVQGDDIDSRRIRARGIALVAAYRERLARNRQRLEEGTEARRQASLRRGMRGDEDVSPWGIANMALGVPSAPLPLTETQLQEVATRDEATERAEFAVEEEGDDPRSEAERVAAMRAWFENGEA